MNEELTERAEEVFCAAYEIRPPDERQAFVDEACAEDGELLAAVMEMLDAQPECDAFFTAHDTDHITVSELTETLAENSDLLAASMPELPDDQAVGECIGPYRLLKKIGEGGIGNVYLAEQEKPVRRRVALKAIKAGMDTRSVIGRFEAERQMLAMMEHPNIAHVFDAGETAAGRPYFVMELVDGVRITTFCDEKRLDIRHRLELFIEVTHAIQHAHQKGIIHRDIKPSNVLITMQDGRPVPKIIDFGIAKATRGQLVTDRTVATLCDPFIGTPVYMSPEQSDLTEENVDIRSDIYSLGVQLYELLAGETPFSREELLEAGLYGMRQILREREPPRPSVKFRGRSREEQAEIAAARQVDRRHLEAMLAGELDWIVMKAIEKDRERRYKTVDALAEDIQRYLGCQPVIARPPSKWYRFRKMVRRNKGLYASIAAVSLALIAGMGTSLWLFVKERAALRGQMDLRAIAEQARAGEARLRIEAEAREKITQAAVLLSRNRYPEAEKMVEECDLPVIRPSMEARDVFFNLANWRILDGLWDQGAEHMLKFARAVQVDRFDMTHETTQRLICVAPALVAAGRLDDYHQFVRDTITHFSQPGNAVAADHVLRISTLVPVDESLLAGLEPLAGIIRNEVVENVVIPHEWREYANDWHFLIVALYEYRLGNFQEALDWANNGLMRPDPCLARIAESHIVLSLSLYRLGQADAAYAELEEGRRMIDLRFPQGLERVGKYGDMASGFWHDWVNAYILMNEARSIMAK